MQKFKKWLVVAASDQAVMDTTGWLAESTGKNG